MGRPAGSTAHSPAKRDLLSALSADIDSAVAVTALRVVAA
jgi:hypothetical protein